MRLCGYNVLDVEKVLYKYSISDVRDYLNVLDDKEQSELKTQLFLLEIELTHLNRLMGINESVKLIDIFNNQDNQEKKRESKLDEYTRLYGKKSAEWMIANEKF